MIMTDAGSLYTNSKIEKAFEQKKASKELNSKVDLTIASPTANIRTRVESPLFKPKTPYVSENRNLLGTNSFNGMRYS